MFGGRRIHFGGVVLAIASLAILAGACTNGSLKSKASSARTTVGLGADSSAATSYPINVTNVLRTVSDPAGSLDLVGDGTNTITQFCVTLDGTSNGPSTCSCEYSYLDAGGNRQVLEAPSVYMEPNLLRCKTSTLPSNLASVDVRIKLTAAGAYSNRFTFAFYGTGLSVDITNPDTYQPVSRYQCKDAVFVPYLLNPTKIYDPILSEDGEVSYPLNFYSANYGSVFQAFVSNPGTLPSSRGSGWICPTFPNDPSDTNAANDMLLFSVAPNGNASKLIHPSVGGQEDRESFLLPSAPVGVFQVPVNAYVAPSTVTVTPATGGRKAGDPPLPLGYGAAPIPNGAGGENCPAVQVPAGYHFVKVWLFRASLADRKVRSGPNVQKIGSIACNPGNFPGGAQIFTDCVGNSITQRVTPIASLKTNYCFNVTKGGNGTLNSTTRGDTWNRVNAAVSVCPDGTPDPLGIYGCNATATRLTTPTDPSPTIDSLDSGVSRYDYVFVVSPTTIMSSDFKNGTSASLPYTPYRYPSHLDCASPTEAGCPQAKIISYGVKFHDVTTNGDAPSTDPGRLPVFPVCALQK